MTQLEEFMLETEDAVTQFALETTKMRRGSGIPPPPQITVVETKLEPQRFLVNFRTQAQNAEQPQ